MLPSLECLTSYSWLGSSHLKYIERVNEMRKEKLFKIRYRWHSGNTYDTQVVLESTLEEMLTNPKWVITIIKEY